MLLQVHNSSVTLMRQARRSVGAKLQSADVILQGQDVDMDALRPNYRLRMDTLTLSLLFL